MHKTITIVSLNIWDLPFWFVKDRSKRIVHIAAYLNDLDADIICLQESFDPHHRKKLHALFDAHQHTDIEHAYRNFFFVSLDTTGGLITFSKFPILATSFHRFGRSFFSPIEFFSGKGMLVTYIQTPHGVLRVANFHLHKKGFLFDEAVRLQQMKFMLAGLQDHIMPTVLAGDCNEHDILNNKKFSTLFDAYGFIHPHADILHPSYRWDNPYVNTWINAISQSKRIDYMMHNDLSPLQLQPEQYSVLYPENPLSDHDPIMLVLGNKS